MPSHTDFEAAPLSGNLRRRLRVDMKRIHSQSEDRVIKMQQRGQVFWYDPHDAVDRWQQVAAGGAPVSRTVSLG
ncbi:hypothetical protein O9K51_01207 [Purpureocillium lavendulum]|uniref:Uncharacterized protein n=1 Tax=Purpureocillium lavendulum TaxID=1247861 RepID=A0AB34G5M5_9HYPO|nr:hypothetical protein O9K51_01207 [Purpureocillium lavendulum]